MNVGVSIKTALAAQEKSRAWLSEQTGLSRQRISALANSNNCNTETLARLAQAFNMSASEFVALSEGNA